VLGDTSLLRRTWSLCTNRRHLTCCLIMATVLHACKTSLAYAEFILVETQPYSLSMAHCNRLKRLVSSSCDCRWTDSVDCCKVRLVQRLLAGGRYIVVAGEFSRWRNNVELDSPDSRMHTHSSAKFGEPQSACSGLECLQDLFKPIEVSSTSPHPNVLPA
jgi:hypothetical protein